MAVARFHTGSVKYSPYSVGEYPLGELSVLEGDTARAFVSMWKYPAGTFDYEVQADNVLYMVSGDGHIEMMDGSDSFDVGPGDAFVLPEGTKITWEVRTDMEVYCVLVTDQSRVEKVKAGEIHGWGGEAQGA